MIIVLLYINDIQTNFFPIHQFNAVQTFYGITFEITLIFYYAVILSPHILLRLLVISVTQCIFNIIINNTRQYIDRLSKY